MANYSRCYRRWPSKEKRDEILADLEVRNRRRREGNLVTLGCPTCKDGLHSPGGDGSCLCCKVRLPEDYGRVTGRLF